MSRMLSGEVGRGIAVIVALAAGLMTPARAHAASPWTPPSTAAAEQPATVMVQGVALSGAGEAWVGMTSWPFDPVSRPSFVAVRRDAATGTFGAPVVLSSPLGEVVRGALVGRQDGAVTAAWDETPAWPGRTSVVARSVAAGATSFGAPQTLSVAGVGTKFEDVAAGADGTVAVLMGRGSGASQSHAVAVRLPGAATFGPAEDVGAGLAASLAVGPDGTVAVLRQRYPAPESAQQVVTLTERPPGGTFGAPTDVSDPGDVSFASLAIDATGRQTLVWLERRPYPLSDERVMTRTRTADGQLGEPEVLSAPGASPGPPSVVARGVRREVLWRQDPGLFSLATASGDQPWSVSPLSNPDQSAGSVVFAPLGDGGTLAAWMDEGIDDAVVVTATRAADGTVTRTPHDTVVRDSLTDQPGVAADDAGNALVAWISTRDIDPREDYIAPAGTLRAMLRDVGDPVIDELTVPGHATAGQPISMAARAHDALTGVTISWDFGDGTTADGPSASHLYAHPGERAVSVVVQDAAGNVARDTRSIVVDPAPPAPAGSPPQADPGAPTDVGVAGAAPPALTTLRPIVSTVWGAPRATARRTSDGEADRSGDPRGAALQRRWLPLRAPRRGGPRDDARPRGRARARRGRARRAADRSACGAAAHHRVPGAPRPCTAAPRLRAPPRTHPLNSAGDRARRHGRRRRCWTRMVRC